VPADIRLGSIRFDPHPPLVEEPITFYAECLNVGDEPTGEFVAKFQLDASESFEVEVPNIPPGDTVYASWPHTPIAGGNHSIYCLLDAGGRVPEPEERYNQQTQYFEVGTRELPPSDSDGTEYYDDNAVAGAVVNQAGVRVNHWISLVLQAAEEWEGESEQRIKAWEAEGEAPVDFMSVAWAFASAVISHTPGASQGMAVIENVSEIYDKIQEFHGEATDEKAAKARLEAEVRRLKKGAGAALRDATNGFEGRLQAWLSPKNDESPLTFVEKGSTDPAYIGELCDWLGFVEPTEANTTVPIKKELTEAFDKVLEDVNRALFREMGYG
jgi:CARDB